MNDTTQISCAVCAGVAVEVERGMLAESLDGVEETCATCGALGKLVLCDDEGQVWLEFRPLPPSRMGCPGLDP